MDAEFREESTKVPQANGKSIELEPRLPWPSAYRGSRYSIISDEDFTGSVLKWEQRDLEIYTEPPDDLRRLLVFLGKEEGYGSIRVTAGGEVLTKIPAEEYEHVDKAPIDSGWIPVYVGELTGSLDFDEVDINPNAPDEGQIKVWKGFPFNHGERWSVSHDGELVWKWRDYRFESAFDHPELVEAYQQYRGQAGRLYITENNHVWINVPRDDIGAGKEDAISSAVGQWKQQADEDGDNATLRLVNRRLVATSRGNDPATGHLPIHLGHLGQFDDGVIPRPVVDDQSYFQAVCDYENVYE
jgi:hypothetical protein